MPRSAETKVLIDSKYPDSAEVALVIARRSGTSLTLADELTTVVERMWEIDEEGDRIEIL